MRLTLSELARRFDLKLHGDGAAVIEGVCTLRPGLPGRIAFLGNSKYRAQLAESAAGAVIVGARDAQALPGNGLVAPDPYLAYARIARLFDPWREFAPDHVNPTAVVAPGARIGKGCFIGAQAVIEAGAEVGEASYIGPQCFIGRDARIGAGSRLEARVYVWHGVRMGARCNVQPGAVIGSRGFGNAPTPKGWEEVPQLGSVIIGDDVEIGANTTIDRGALEDTVLEDGVKLDNQIQIAHNVRIGAHTAIAACTGIAGSTRIGSRCMIGGAVGMAGHIEIADDVVILGRAMITGSIAEKGVYGGGLPSAPVREWRKTVARVRRLGKLEQRLKAVEQKLGVDAGQGEGEDGGTDD